MRKLDEERTLPAGALRIAPAEGTVFARHMNVALEGEGDHQLNPGTAGDD